MEGHVREHRIPLGNGGRCTVWLFVDGPGAWSWAAWTSAPGHNGKGWQTQDSRDRWPNEANALAIALLTCASWWEQQGVPQLAGPIREAFDSWE